MRHNSHDAIGAAGTHMFCRVHVFACVNVLLSSQVIFHEQVNKQRRALMFYLDLAMKLKRTLVLPRTRLLRRGKGIGQFEPKADYVGWGELMNVSTIATLHPVMEWEQYVALHGAHVSLLVPLRECKPSQEVVTFNGWPNVQAAKISCEPGAQYAPNRLLQPPYAELESIAFMDTTDQLEMRTALGLRPFVQFTHDTYSLAADFAAKAFGGRKFVAVHWRQTDFLAVRRSQVGVLQSAAMVVGHIKALLRARGLQDVYLATDCDDPRELAAVVQALSPARYEPGSAGDKSLGLLERTKIANVEIAICAMADAFMGTGTSSFTLAITEERTAVFQKPPQSTSEMKGPPPKDEL